jgi:RNA polymerase sigma factor (sigma-70 family)
MLYEVFYGKMLLVCKRYIPGDDDAVSVLNDGFYKVFSNIRKIDLRKETNISGWIYRIMVNTCLDFCRKDLRVKQMISPIEDRYEQAGDIEQIISQINALDILRMIQTLPPAYRLVFNLYEIEGYDHKEIAKSLNISVNTSKSNLSRAKAKLRDMIINEDSSLKSNTTR